MRTFRFGVNTLPSDHDDWALGCRVTEEQGFDLLLAPDHLGSHSPLAALGAAAAVTTRMRLGTYVLNNEFWNPALLAREVATLDRISGGRFELGLGSGYMKREFEDAGIPWLPHADRTANLVAALDELDRRLAEGGQEPRPVQCPRPPVLIGGHGPSTLALAARRADTVAFSGVTQTRGRKMGVFTMAGAAETRQRVELVREAAGERAFESGVLVQKVIVTDDAEKEVAQITERVGEELLPKGESLLDCPYLLVGTPREIADTLLRRRAEFGFTHVVTHGPSRDALAEVIPLIRAAEAAWVAGT
ncbi:TIGR03621 family F420-dependent LLM class oxidoreductase [Nocardiopsis metallicus]|uniref:Putative F420-dependent oxidoreductase n=1 Tax=Nocardiopsis metallicus TaxID=179819 RepID=A0A840WB10_9ACTN|nr:TIGR03621 family F420-dependent LLM class oxidoreductase [Nocardiopsis metallicus]MBB5488967.1 putative F420-dependent oxidoreductase [Nocardiopsis metallicus]